MSKQRRSFTPEYKEQLARMVVEQSGPIAAVVKEIGVNEQTLRELGERVSGRARR